MRKEKPLVIVATPNLQTLIHISETTRLLSTSYSVFCMKKKHSYKSLQVDTTDTN